MDNKRKAKMLVKSFQDAIGGGELPETEVHNKTHLADDATYGSSSSSNASVADSDQHSVGGEVEPPRPLRKPMSASHGVDVGHSRSMKDLSIDPELIWNSKRSDCYKATAVREQVRKN